MVLSFFNRRPSRSAIVPLVAEQVSALQLRSDSLYDAPGTLQTYLQVLAQPFENEARRAPLAWMREDGSEYVIGGRWRRRNDVGELVELSATGTRNAEELVERLLDAYRENGYDLVLLGFGEQDRARTFYTRRGWLPLDDVVYYEWRSSPLPQTPLSNDLSLHLFDPNDLNALVELDHASFPWLWWNSYTEMRWYAGLPDVEIWVLEDTDGRLLGYSGGTIYTDKGHLDRLAVLPEVQGRGYGAILLHNALERLVMHGANEVALSTQIDNTRSQRLYTRYGFRRSRVRFQIYGRWIGNPL